MAGAGRRGREREKRGQQTLKNATVTDGFHDHFPLIWGMRDIFIIKMFKKEANPNTRRTTPASGLHGAPLRRPRSTAHSSVTTTLYYTSAGGSRPLCGETEAQLAGR